MRVTVKHPDGSKTVYFGLSDFQTELDSDEVSLFFHMEVASDPDERELTVDGGVVSSVCETSYDETTAYETIGGNGHAEDVGVVVGITDRYPDVAFAARDLRDDDGYDGDVTFLGG